MDLVLEKKLKIEKTIIDSILKFVSFQLIELKGNKVIKKDPREALDFNAFAQGYSVDVVSDFLNSKGIKSYIVEIGVEVYAKGRKPDGKNWTIVIEKPIDNKESENACANVFTIKVFANPGTSASPNGTVQFWTGPNGTGTLKYKMKVDAKGNFYTSGSVALTAGLYPAVTGATSTKYMSSPVTNGACNSCHTGTSTARVWTN